MSRHYDGYLKIDINPRENYSIDGIEIINTTNNSAHIFIKVFEEDEAIEVDYVSSTCASDYEEEMIEINLNLNSEEASSEN